jgi:hypothetical protein
MRKIGEGGQAGIILVVALIVILAIAGLAIDGGAAVTAKIGLESDADAAARAGAGAVDQTPLRSTGEKVLDPVAAEDAARAYIATACPDCTISVVAGPAGVTVTLHRPHPTFFLQAVGIRTVTVAATSISVLVTP